MNQVHATSAPVQSIELAEKMQLTSNVRMLCSRFQTMIRQRRRKQHKRSLEISAPFNLTREPVAIPGVSEDEIAILREKAAASRIGIAEMMPRSVSSLTSHPPMSPIRALPPKAASSPRLMI